MPETLQRSHLSDSALVSLLLLILSIVHFSLLETERSHRFHSHALERAYKGCLIASWIPLFLGAVVLGFFWFVGRNSDGKNFATATANQLCTVMIAASGVAVGCLLLALAEGFWMAEIGFKRFHIVIVLGLLSLLLLLWVAFQVVLVIREAAAVRSFVKDHPYGAHESTDAGLRSDGDVLPGDIPPSPATESPFP